MLDASQNSVSPSVCCGCLYTMKVIFRYFLPRLFSMLVFKECQPGYFNILYYQDSSFVPSVFAVLEEFQKLCVGSEHRYLFYVLPLNVLLNAFSLVLLFVYKAD